MVSIQRWYRCWSMTRREYLALYRAVVLTQATWRGHLARRQTEVRHSLIINL